MTGGACTGFGVNFEALPGSAAPADVKPMPLDALCPKLIAEMAVKEAMTALLRGALIHDGSRQL